MSLPPWSHILPLFFCLYEFYLLSQSTHTINYVIILLLMYLHPDLFLLLHLPFESTNFPHLVTLCLDLAQTKLKYPYFIALMDLSYLTYCGTTFCSPYMWYNHRICWPTYYIIVLLNCLIFTKSYLSKFTFLNSYLTFPWKGYLSLGPFHGIHSLYTKMPLMRWQQRPGRGWDRGAIPYHKENVPSQQCHRLVGFCLRPSSTIVIIIVIATVAEDAWQRAGMVWRQLGAIHSCIGWGERRPQELRLRGRACEGWGAMMATGPVWFCVESYHLTRLK